MTSLAPMYWFKEFWLDELYRRGVEASAERWTSGNSIPIGGLIIDGESPYNDGLTETRNRWDRCSFYWSPFVQTSCTNGNPMEVTMRVKGYKLYGKVQREDDSYRGVLQVFHDYGERGTSVGACREFYAGDAITLVSTFEATTPKKLFLGGIYVRVGNDRESNAYLTKNGVLRATKAIMTGEEIVRFSENWVPERDLEQIDKVVLSKELLKGRITIESQNNILHIEYEDGSTERIDRDEVYRDFRKGFCKRVRRS